MADDKNVVTFPGSVPPQGAELEQPAPNVIDLLERMLDMAKQGILQGVAIGTVNRGGMVGNTWSISPAVNSHLLVAAAGYLLTDVSTRSSTTISTPSDQV